MKYMVDIDGTICKEIFLSDGKKDYANHQPMQERIAKINTLLDSTWSHQWHRLHTVNQTTIRKMGLQVSQC